MSSPQDNYHSAFPAVPPSLSTGDHGMRVYHAAQEHSAQRPVAHSLEDITPYLGLRARLSQVWINKWTVLILLVLARVLIAIGNLHDDIDNAQVQALSACSSVESMGSTVASLPHYMAQGTNELAAHGVTKTVDGLQEMLLMTVTAAEEIFVFWINMMYGTYECLLTFAIGGAAHVAVQVAEDVTRFLNGTLGGIEKDIATGVLGFQNDLNKFLSVVNNVGSVFGGGSTTPPTLDLTKQLTELSNIQLPTSINEGLNQLNSSIPDFAQVQNLTNTVLKFPFEEIKRLLNETMGNYTFNSSLFPIPQKQALTFCSDNDGISDFFGALYTTADIARKVFIAVLLLLALAACVPTALLEIRRWRTMQQRARLVQQSAHNPMDVIYIASRPYTAGAGLKMSRNFASPKRQLLTRWFVAYVTSTPALVVLALALAGLFSCFCQFLLLQAVRREVPELADQVGAFGDKVVDSLNNASAAWANGTNSLILAENTKLNDDIFGWVNTSTTAVNNTLNSFINETTTVIQKAFGGTVLEDPVQQVFNCLIGLKVARIEQGLTWLQDNAYVTFPLFPNDTFSAGAASTLASTNQQTGTNANGDSFLADPGSDASDKVTAAVDALTNKLASGIRTEALISTAVLMLYVLVVLMALARVLWRLCRRDRVRGEGGATYAGDIDQYNVDYHQHMANGNEMMMASDDKNTKAAVATATAANGPYENHDTAASTPIHGQFTGSVRPVGSQQYQQQQESGFAVAPTPSPAYDEKFRRASRVRNLLHTGNSQHGFDNEKKSNF